MYTETLRKLFVWLMDWATWIWVNTRDSSAVWTTDTMYDYFIREIYGQPIRTLAYIVLGLQVSHHALRLFFRMYGVCRWFGGAITKSIVYLERKVRKYKRDMVGFVPEKAIPGSDYNTVKEHHPCSAMIFGTFNEGDAPTYRGMCFRLDDTIVTATHVIDGLESCWIQSKSNRVQVEPKIFTQKESDVSYCLIGDTLQSLGLVKWKVCSPGIGLGAVHYVSVRAKINPMETQGMIRASDDLCYVTYNGSTTYGFSGAPYVSGKAIYGMHVGSHNTNIGVDATYIKTLISLQQESGPEVAGWLRNEETVRGKPLQDGGYAVPSFKGYRYVSDSAFEEYLEKKGKNRTNTGVFERTDFNWYDATEELGGGPDYEPECQKLEPELEPMANQALNYNGFCKPANRTPAVVLPAMKSTGMTVEINPAPVQPKRRKPLHLTLPLQHLSGMQMKELTGVLESILAQQNGASKSMQGSLKRSINALKLLATENSPISSIAPPECFPAVGSQS